MVNSAQPDLFQSQSPRADARSEKEVGSLLNKCLFFRRTPLIHQESQGGVARWKNTFKAKNSNQKTFNGSITR